MTESIRRSADDYIFPLYSRPMTTAELADKYGKPVESVSRSLRQLIERGHVERTGKQYRLTEAGYIRAQWLGCK